MKLFRYREVILKLILSLSLLLALAIAIVAQPAVVTAVRGHRQAYEREILNEFIQLLALPNVASDLPNIRRNAELISRMLAARGIKPATARSNGRAARRVWRNHDTRRDAHADFLCALRWPTGRAWQMGRRRSFRPNAAFCIA